jgi:hypothetical protein
MGYQTPRGEGIATGDRLSGMQGFERCVVLVADDEPVVLKLVRTALIRHGYVVIATEDDPPPCTFARTEPGRFTWRYSMS